MILFYIYCKLLSYLSVLQFVLSLQQQYYEDDEGCWMLPDNVIPCLTYNLKTVEFVSQNKELELMRFY